MKVSLDEIIHVDLTDEDLGEYGTPDESPIHLSYYPSTPKDEAGYFLVIGPLRIKLTESQKCEIRDYFDGT